MKRWMSVFVVAAFVVAAAAPAAMAAQRVHRIWGKVAQVESAKKEVVVNAHLKNNKWKKVSFSVSDQSKIMAGHEKKALSDLKKGEAVTVSYTVKGKAHAATEILVHAPAAAHPKKATKAKDAKKAMKAKKK